MKPPKGIMLGHLKDVRTSSFRNSPPEMFCKKDILKILENSQENTCVGVSFLITLQAWGLQPYLRCTLRSETIFVNWKPFKNDEK